jgi:hypothetical protein
MCVAQGHPPIIRALLQAQPNQRSLFSAARCWALTLPIATSRMFLGGDTDPHAQTTAAPMGLCRSTRAPLAFKAMLTPC